MKNFFTKDVLAHPLVVVAFGIVVLIALGSGAYYVIETRAPSVTWGHPAVGSIEAVVAGTGTVAPAQNPDLAFESGGRVASVSVHVGQDVKQGEVLASLDTAALGAARTQAAANLAAAQAKLDEMQAGPRQTDVSAKQTAVSQAQQSLANVYATVPSSVEDAYGKSFGNVRSDTDPLFSNPSSESPTIAFQSTDNQALQNAQTQRLTLNGDLATWQSEVNTLSADSSTAELEAALATSLTHLQGVRTYANTLLQALASAIPSSNFSAATIAADQTSVGDLRDSASTLIASVQTLQQQIASDKLVVQSAQDALNQVLAGSTPQDIEAQQATVEAAQAAVESAQAALSNAIVVAPFSGTVSSVAVKVGQTVAANTTAVSLTPNSALQVEIYVTEVDVAWLKVGQQADVTLDAYGDSRHFPATVATIDTSPTAAEGYKVTLQFAQNDPAISAGMTANVTILAAQKDNTLTIPRGALLQSNGEDFVLVQGGGGPIERQVTVGIVSTSTVEVTSGLTPSDEIVIEH